MKLTLLKDNSDDQVCTPNPQIFHHLHLLLHLNLQPFFNLAQQINKAQNLHLKVHYPVDREHLQHQLALQMHHLHIHLHSHSYTHNTNPRFLHPHSTHHQNPINNKFNTHLLKQMLTSLLSFPFQMKKNSAYPNLQIIAR